MHDGSTELEEALSDGAEEILASKAGEESIGMLADPVEEKETKITYMPNNGHAMSAYMMSVALWVGCLALCLMYPLTKYKGELKGGMSWWISKASVLTVVSVIMAIVMITMLRIVNGFTPKSYVSVLLVAVVASLTFMSIMYFFDVLFGKIGSFMMLVFMVLQLAGSAGTYPVEISGAFVAKIHAYLPFTYTVDAFRMAIAGKSGYGQMIGNLCFIMVIFTVLTILMFEVKTYKIRKNKALLEDFYEEHGLA